MLSDASALCRYTARDSLLRLGDSATGPTARFLFSAAPDSVEAALEVSLGLANAVLLPAAQALARNAQTTRARALATRLLGAIGEAESITTLRELLRDDDAEVRMAAADSLGRIADWPSATALELLLDDVDWEVRRHAALALRDLGPPGILVLQRASRARRGHGADMARHVLDLPDLMTH